MLVRCVVESSSTCGNKGRDGGTDWKNSHKDTDFRGILYDSNSGCSHASIQTAREIGGKVHITRAMVIATGDNDTLSVVKNKKFTRLVRKGIAEVVIYFCLGWRVGMSPKGKGVNCIRVWKSEHVLISIQNTTCVLG